VRGKVDGGKFPIRSASFSINDGPMLPLYVEQEPDDATDWVHGYKATPAELRCRDQGEFCIEFAATDPQLRVGSNALSVTVQDQDWRTETLACSIEWNPEPLPVALDLSDLSRFGHIQDVGQTVNGAFDLDRDLNVIRSRAPVAPDALLVIGSPYGSQEATYAVRFLEPQGAKWLGCSDFFAGLVEGVPGRGIRVGWCSAGMAALSPTDGARSFIAWGDHSGDNREWALATHPAAPIRIQRNTLYRVRHQITLQEGRDRVRWRLWPDGEPEPGDWLCEEEASRVPAELPRHRAASFALFQHMGQCIEWSDIVIRPYRPPPGDAPGRGREPFLKRNRPGAF
jgi:hypothetical protein